MTAAGVGTAPSEARPAAPVVRFAPSPTGFLHIGNARTALYNALFARRAGGTFILRLDDTDRERCEQRFADRIASDLAWLGIPPDRVVRQSDRIALYEAMLARLIASGDAYHCYETAEELERARRLRLARGLPPVYDRAALRLSDADRARLEGEGRRPHVRFRLPVPDPAAGLPAEGVGRVEWEDLCRGRLAVNLPTVSDPVIRREDGTFLYMFPSVVDDIDLGITAVVRGEDHIVNTGVQIAMFAALGAEPPAFGHHNLIVRVDGEALSKRSGALSLGALADAGFEPMAVAALATLVGTSRPVEPVEALDALAARLDLSAVSRSPARFDESELAGLNAALVHRMPFGRVADRLAAMGVGGGEAFWDAVRANLAKVPEAADWWHVLEGPVDLASAAIAPADRAFLAEAAAALPPEPWTADTFGVWIDALKTTTGRKGKALFGPIRAALTGRPSGPELARLLPALGRRRTEDRLSAAAATLPAPSSPERPSSPS